MIPPETKYTKVGGSHVGYQVFGDGPIDLVYVTGIISNVDVFWEFPPIQRLLKRLASFSRVIMFDRRGSGVSDPIALETLPTWEQWTEDLKAVMDAAGSEHAALLGQADGGVWAMLFAATHPERTTALVLWNSFARVLADDDYEIGHSPEEQDAIAATLSQLWGTKALAAMTMGLEHGGDEEALHWLAKLFRAAMPPGPAAAQMKYGVAVDVRDVLGSIRVPTLVMHSRDNEWVPLEMGRYLAERIPGARFVQFPTASGNLFDAVGERAQDLIEDFLSDVRQAGEPDRVLATVFFTDIVGSTEHAAQVGDQRWKEMLAEHDQLTREQVERFRGRVIKTTGDGVLATFDGPGRAIRCSIAVKRALKHSGIEIRTGLHTGEIELTGEDIGGIAVHVAARVMAEASPGEVVCSRTVKDLVAGSEFTFEDRGVRALKGVPDEWQLYTVRAT